MLHGRRGAHRRGVHLRHHVGYQRYWAHPRHRSCDRHDEQWRAEVRAPGRHANVKIADFPLLQILRNQANGADTYPNPLRYAPGVVPVTADDLTDIAPH